MQPHSSTTGASRVRRWSRAATALALPATTLALIGLSAPAHAANPAEDCVLSGDSFSCTLVYTTTGGEQTLLVPDGVTTIDVEAIGGSGGGSAGGGRGAVVTGSQAVTPGATYYVMVGGNGGGYTAGYNGGGNPTGDSSTGGGGGATDLRTVSGDLSSRLLVAGGGGGADVSFSFGGNAGQVGSAGSAGTNATGGPGQGGTQSAGGAGGSGATAGALGVGGNGGLNFGGGGGGGLYGGGGGGGSSNGTGNGGGGGSSLAPADGSVAVNTANAAPRLAVTYTSPVTDADLQLGAPSVAAGVANPVTMSVTDGSVTAPATPQSLTISPNGTGTGASCTATACSATGIGTYTVTATYAGFSRTRTFSVVAGPAASIELTPASSSATAGAQLAYTVTGTDEFGNSLGDITADSLVTTTGPGGTGIACPAGVCKVEIVGAYTVDASAPGAAGAAVTDTANLAIVPAAVASLQVSPANAVVAAGQARAYAVSGADRFGNSLGDLTSSATFSLTPVGGGPSIACTDATCTPSTAGVYEVSAEVGGVTGTATLVAQALDASVAVAPVSGVVFGDTVPVSATVTSPSGGTPTGSVQFALDGDAIGGPVALSSGTASLPDVSGLPAGLHTLAASYVSDDGTYTRDDGVAAFVIARASTTTAVTATPGRLTAVVSGVGEPTGDVQFLVDGVEVGTAPLVDGTAVLEGTAHDGGSVVGAAYGGDADHEASATSTTRSTPVVRTKVTGKGGPGWYSGPVTVTFECGPAVTSCPAPAVVSTEGAGQYVTRTVVGSDGGVAVVTAGPLNLDLTAPTARLSRVADGRTYKGRARIAQCEGADTLSGLASCEVSTTGGPFGAVTSTATVTDVAGNKTTSSATYDVLDVWVARSKRDGSSWTVRSGKWRKLHVMSTKAPRMTTSGAVRATRFTMVGRTGGITRWVASVRADRSARVKVVSSEGTSVVRLRVTR